MSRAVLAAAALASGLLAAPAAAQDSLPPATQGRMRLRATAVGEGRYVQHRVNAGNGVELSSGSIFGGSVALAIGRNVELAVAGATGSLTADSAQADDATMARGEVRVAVLPVPWLALRLGVTRHTFAGDVAVQRWTAVRLGGEGRLVFVGGKLNGIVRFELFPLMSVSGLERPSRGFGAASGLSFASGVVTGYVLYELERYDFPRVGAVERRQQIGYLTAGIGLRVPGN